MKSLSKFSKAAITSFWVLFILQILSSCNCTKHGSKGKNVVMYGCIATEYQVKNVAHK